MALLTHLHPPLPPAPADPEEALAPFEPSDAAPFDRRLAAHLLRRAGFGGTREEVEAAAAAGPRRAVDALVDAPADPSLAELDEAIETLLDFEDPERLQGWWTLRMARTRAPLREKVALFLHGHFATGWRKVRSVRAMYGQARLFLDEGLGSFRGVARRIAADPAMLVYLDGTRSRRGSPNENFARELMELFTLGRGNYSETDIREAARAFTGWRVDGATSRFHERSHDAGEKTVFGHAGAFRGEDVVDLCIDHPACAPFLAGKLLRFLLMPAPPEPLVAAFARRIRDAGFDLREPLRTLFASRVFHSDGAYRALVKSPAELAAGTLRTLGGRTAGAPLAQAVGAMGQVLFDPPSVKGWDGGLAWIHSATWIARARFAARATRDGGPLGREYSLGAIFGAEDRASADACVGRALDLLVQGDVPEAARAALADALGRAGVSDDALRSLLHAVLLLPESHVA